MTRSTGSLSIHLYLYFIYILFHLYVYLNQDFGSPVFIQLLVHRNSFFLEASYVISLLPVILTRWPCVLLSCEYGHKPLRIWGKYVQSKCLTFKMLHIIRFWHYNLQIQKPQKFKRNWKFEVLLEIYTYTYIHRCICIYIQTYRPINIYFRRPQISYWPRNRNDRHNCEAVALKVLYQFVSNIYGITKESATMDLRKRHYNNNSIGVQKISLVTMK